MRRYRRGPAESGEPTCRARAPPAARRSRRRGPGRSTTARRSASSAQIGVPACTSAGLHGEGVVIAVFDAGFPNLAHEVFAPMTILAERDFVNGDDDSVRRDQGEGSHGTAPCPCWAASRRAS